MYQSFRMVRKFFIMEVSSGRGIFSALLGIIVPIVQELTCLTDGPQD